MDSPTTPVFNFGTLLAFSVLAVAAICYRRRPAVHKRLMLFANISLMAAPIAHLLGHIPSTWLPPAIGGDAAVAILNILFLVAPIAGD